jgi:hypothetical protein
MSTRQRLLLALVAGTAVLIAGMKVVEELFWASCSGVDIHRDHEIWICWNFLYLWVASACAAGLLAGLVGRTRGVFVGGIITVVGLALYALAFRSPFGADHVATLKHALLFFVLPNAVASILGARITGKGWRHAL